MLTRLTLLATSTPSPRAWPYKPPAAPAANNSTASSTSPYGPGQPDTSRPGATRCLKGSTPQGAGGGRLLRSALEAQDKTTALSTHGSPSIGGLCGRGALFGAEPRLLRAKASVRSKSAPFHCDLNRSMHHP